VTSISDDRIQQKDSKLTPSQIKKGLILTACFLVVRLVAAWLWMRWFDMNYHLTIPFLAFLLTIFFVSSVGIVVLGFTKWVGVDLKTWWFRRGRILRDIAWGVGILIGSGVLLLAAGIVMLAFDLLPTTPLVVGQETTPLSQLPIDLTLGWLFGFGIASFGEETLFRGFLQRVFDRRVSRWTSNLLQAALFSLTHLGMEPLQSVGHLAFLLLFRFGFGLLMGWLKMKRGTLLSAGIVHGFWG